MFKRSALAALVVYVLWAVMDMILHGMILRSTYAEYAGTLFRPENEMKMGVIQIVVAVSAVGFVLIYARMVSEKTMTNAIIYALVFGIITGMGMGYGTYSAIPIPYKLAFAWFWGSVVEALAAGIVLGLIVKPDRAEA